MNLLLRGFISIRRKLLTEYFNKFILLCLNVYLIIHFIFFFLRKICHEIKKVNIIFAKYISKVFVNCSGRNEKEPPIYLLQCLVCLNVRPMAHVFPRWFKLITKRHYPYMHK